MQIDRRRPRRAQRFDHVLQACIAGIIGQPERHAIGCRGPDQRRAAHLHDTNGMRGVLQRSQPQHHRFARQARLVEDQHGFAVFDQCGVSVSRDHGAKLA